MSTLFPGPRHLRPTIHFAPNYVSDQGGWHDIAGAMSIDGVHHVYQGWGWNHAISEDLVHWKTVAHGPSAIHETYAGMDSTSTPCSGFLFRDDMTEGAPVCAGFRQCWSRKGVSGHADWDVPLEVRCASDGKNLTGWSTQPDYLFNVSFYRGLPYDPARPWREEADGQLYMLLAMDGCNATTRRAPCGAGGQLHMWTSPALRGTHAVWRHLGPVFTSNRTVLPSVTFASEFVTIDYIGRLPGDHSNRGGNGSSLGTRLFFTNIFTTQPAGSIGCCGASTSYYVVEQVKPGGPMVEVAPQGMVDWCATRSSEDLLRP